MKEFSYYELDVKHWQKKIDRWFFLIMLGILYGLARYYFADSSLPGRTFGQFLFAAIIPAALIYVAIILIYFGFVYGTMLMVSKTFRPVYMFPVAWMVTMTYIVENVITLFLASSSNKRVVRVYLPESLTGAFYLSNGTHNSSSFYLYPEGSLMYKIRKTMTDLDL